MHLDKQIKKELNIKLNSIEKLKLMNMKQDQLKWWENLVHKWKEDSFGLIKEMINHVNQEFILQVKCGMQEEKKQHCLYKDFLEVG